MSVRVELGQLPAGTELLTRLRYMPDSEFAEFTDAELDAAVRWLYVARYSALEGARKLQRILVAREKKEGGVPCSSSSRSSIATESTGRTSVSS